MKALRKIFFVVISCCAFYFLHAQQNRYRAVHWGYDEGLSNATIAGMIKDVNGFLWIATPFGLNRFDGSTFKKYFADKTKKNQTIVSSFTSIWRKLRK